MHIDKYIQPRKVRLSESPEEYSLSVRERERERERETERESQTERASQTEREREGWRERAIPDRVLHKHSKVTDM
jgi:hypothetical protein